MLRLTEEKSPIYIGVLDSYGDWLQCYVSYTENDKRAGYINFQLNLSSKEIFIDMISVDEGSRRKGIATKMLYALRDEYPDYYVDWGYTTEDGTKLKTALTVTEENEKYVNMQRAIDTCDKLLAQLEEKLNDDEWLETTPHDEIEKTALKWDKINSKKRDLEYDIQDMRQYITRWK